MLTRFFVDRPVFATVLSVVIVLVGLVSLMQLPIAQYPEVVPPTVQVQAVYPGASANVVAETVASVIEQEINGVEGMLYMQSKSTNDGTVNIQVTFELGTDIDFAQVLVQNRVAIAEAKLPEEVRRNGVTVKKQSPNILLAINLISPDGSRDQTFLSNYATLQLKDELARVPGVGDVQFLGARDYSMRIWIDPNKLQTRNLTATDVVRALQEQNVQVAAGRLGQPPAPADQQFQLTINTLGRLPDAAEFARVIVKRGDDGQIVRVGDVARVELGAKNYDVSSYLDGQPSTLLAAFQLPGSNALQTATQIRATMDRLAQRFPSGVEYRIVYDTTEFINESVHAVYHTLFEAFLLVFLVVLVFLQDWKATMLPMIDVIVSLVGTFFVMSLLGFSLNNLSLFGLVLAIGIVVDDAIVVVENIERWVAKGLPAREATIRAMDEITGPVIAITLVLFAVFVPTAFIAGISGQFYRQFALTIAASMGLSAVNALTMAPARAVSIFKSRERPGGAEGHGAEGTEPHGHHLPSEALPWWGFGVLFAALAYMYLAPLLADWLGLVAGHHGPDAAQAGHHATGGWLVDLVGGYTGLVTLVCVVAAVIGMAGYWVWNWLTLAFFVVFNAFFTSLSAAYGRVVGGLLRVSLIVIVLYFGLLGLTARTLMTTPVGFIPEQDKGYLVVSVLLPEGASLERTEQVMAEVDRIMSETPGVRHTLRIPGYHLLQSVNVSSTGGFFVVLDPFHERSKDPLLGARALVPELRNRLMSVQEALVLVLPAPPVDGIGNTGGFKLQVQDRGNSGPLVLEGAAQQLALAANSQPGLIGCFSSYSANQPQLFLDIDRTKAKSIGVSLSEIYGTLQSALGSTYVNDFTYQGRNWQVNVQAESQFRQRVEDVGRLRVRAADGQMVPLGTLVSLREVTGPSVVYRYNLFPSADVMGGTLPGFSSGQAIATLDALSARQLPETMSIEWTELSLQQVLASRDLLTKLVFPLGVLFVFLVLAAQYESWALPLAIILIVPMCILAALVGVNYVGTDNNVFTQIGLVVLVALAAKNAILIVEFAKELETAGKSRFDAAVEACRVRLRPIIMTSLAFILGVLPLVLGKGAGAEMRNTLGVTVFSGMLGVTAFGLVFTPVFYYLIRGWFGGPARSAPAVSSAPESPSI